MSGVRDRVVEARVARLATVRPDGSPHVVPVVFALERETSYIPVDHKPKRTQNLQRLANIRAEPRCSLLVDSYEEDWSRLWWVRLDGIARILETSDRGHAGAAEVLAVKYEQYRQNPIAGPIIAIAVESWTSWPQPV